MLPLENLKLGFNFFFLLTSKISFTERVHHMSKTPEQQGLCTWLFLVFLVTPLSECAVIPAVAVTQNKNESKNSEP